MSKTIKSFLILACLLTTLIMPALFLSTQALAQVPSGSDNTQKPLDRLTGAATKTGAYKAQNADGSNSFAGILGLVVKVALSFLGIIFIILIIMAGFQWMNAGGNEDEVKKAQSKMKNAIIGLIIVLLAYGIYAFIDKNVIQKIQ